jgi:cytochrome c-type biogenesis protein CcmH/NrfG
VRERSGSTDDARAEAQSSLQLAPNVAAYLVLARIDLQINQLSESAYNVANALRLEPNNSAALGMKTALAARGQNIP